MADPDDIWTAALQEAYASAPNDPPVCGEANDYAMQVYPYLAMPDKLTACAGDDALATLAAMGLTQVEVDV